MTKKILLLALITCCSQQVMAKTYKWVDDKGVTHMGDTIPPEYAGKDRAELNKSGRTVSTKDILTAEERRAKEAEQLKASAQETSARDQKLHDKSLTDTYSSVQEIELSRTRSLQQVDARINSINSQLKMNGNSLASLQKDADNRVKSNGKIPFSLQEDIKSAQERDRRLHHDLEKYLAEKSAVNTRYDADKARFRELTGK